MIPPVYGSTCHHLAGETLYFVPVLGRKWPLKRGQRYKDGRKHGHRHKRKWGRRRAMVKVRRRIEAVRAWEAERDREALPDGLEEIQEARLGGLPSGVWQPI